jgi:hypothetical protein
MRKLFLLYFVNLYMFRAYLGLSSGSIAVYIQQLVLGLDSNPNRTTDSHLKRILSTNYCIYIVVPPDDGLRYAQNL